MDVDDTGRMDLRGAELTIHRDKVEVAPTPEETKARAATWGVTRIVLHYLLSINTYIYIYTHTCIHIYIYTCITTCVYAYPK